MWRTTRRLRDLTAQDLMTREIITIPRGMSLRAAAHLLMQMHVSGAPVVNDEGRPIGILTSSDLIRSLEVEMLSGSRAREANNVFADWQVFDCEALSEDEVERFMSPDVITATPATTLVELARTMSEAHVHRVVILDRWGKVIGMVSSMDILAALAHEEAEPEWD